jgi:hypothetical protein
MTDFFPREYNSPNASEYDEFKDLVWEFTQLMMDHDSELLNVTVKLILRTAENSDAQEEQHWTEMRDAIVDLWRQGKVTCELVHKQPGGGPLYRIEYARISSPEQLLSLSSNSSKIHHLMIFLTQDPRPPASITGRELLQYKPIEIAQQMCIAAHFFFRKITKEELTSFKYSNADLCPNIVALKNWNDRYSIIFAP